MTGEPSHTASKERAVPDLMLLSERAPQLPIAECEEVITLHIIQVCSIRYTVLQMKNSTRSANIGKPFCTATTNQHLVLLAKINGTQKRTLVSP